MGRTSVVLAVGDSINLVFVESEPFITIILASVVLNFINFYKKYNVFLESNFLYRNDPAYLTTNKNCNYLGE